MIKVFLNWVQKTKPHIKSETGLLLFVPTIKLTVYLRIPCRIKAEKAAGFPPATNHLFMQK